MKKRTKILLTGLIILFCLVIVVLAAIPPLIINGMVNKHMNVEVYSPEDFGLSDVQALSLQTADGLAIASWLTEVESPKGIVILLSGIQNPSVTAFFGYGKMLSDNGYASLLIEMRAHGSSEGDRVALGMDEWQDVKAGVDYIKSQDALKEVPVIVWGTSMGGTTAINATGEIPEIDGLISCSAFSSWTDVFSDNMTNMGAPSFFPVIERPFVDLYLGFTYGFNKLKIVPTQEIHKLNGRPALIIHSTGDSQVPFSSFDRIMANAPETVETFVRQGDYHFICYDEYFDNPVQDQEFSAVILQFLKKHFE